LTQVVDLAAQDHRNFIESQGLAFHVTLPQGPIWVNGDPTRLTQALGNLLHNAGKFTEVGTVDVRLALDESGRGGVVTVRDTGVGIEREMLEKLFRPFSQADRTLARSKGGLGLGLALAEALIASHDGSVEARSDGSGRGSEFTIRLPVIKEMRSA